MGIMFASIEKRDGRIVPYDISKIERAIEKAMIAGGRPGSENDLELAREVEDRLVATYGETIPNIESIQDVVETVLLDRG